MVKKLSFTFKLFPLRNYYLLFIVFIFSCNKDENNQLLFSEVNTKIKFQNKLTNTTSLNILNYLYYYNGAGVATADFDNDGLLDIYFTGNQVEDELYLNKSNLIFENVILPSNFKNVNGWTTGVTIVDINQDGLMDFYVCKVSGHLKLKGHNLLYVNQGVNENGLPTFKEESQYYGLDFSGYSSQSAFFDFDLDGDLDMYLLNHSLYPNNNYGNGSKRLQVDPLAGDRLYRNDNGKFIDVSEEAGICQGSIGYGLGISISDLNNDGYPDIYVGNDFFENDYLYINQGDGTFKDINTINTPMGHTTHFSMGNCIADVNNDLLPDILSVDMLPEDLKTLKTASTEYNYPIYERYIKNGYNHQYMQNTLHLNKGNLNFSEIANLSGLSATEWSWSPLIADLDNDGLKDVYITNGIKGVTNDMDFINFISDKKIQKQLGKNMTNDALKFIEELPQKKVNNYAFKNLDGLKFQNSSKAWFPVKLTFSNGATYADFDNDGDLDIIVNEVNERSSLYENHSEEQLKNNYLKINFKGSIKNRNGIGAKVVLYHNNQTQFAENYTTQGYLSATSPNIHFGLGDKTIVDSLTVIWPTKQWETIKNIDANQNITLDFYDAEGDYYLDKIFNENPEFILTSSIIKYKHEDQETIDFSRDPLLPFSQSNNAPDIAIGDINHDGLDDVVITGAKRQPSQIWLQQKNQKFEKYSSKILDNDAICDDTSIIIIDINGDKKNEIIIASGGNEFTKGLPLQPRLYYFENSILKKDDTQFNLLEINTSKITAVDFDKDGDKDLCFTSNLKPHHFGESPQQYLFENNGRGQFEDVTEDWSTEFKNIGNVYDIIWKDIDNNGFKDAVVAGHFMPISVFLNDGIQLKLSKSSGIEKSLGWWNCLAVEDYDKDGDYDIISGNWGLNTRLKASIKEPIKLYRQDFDDNGSKETIVTYYYQGQETTIATKDELVKQIPKLNKKFLSYSDFAKASIEDLFGEEELEKAIKKQVTTLATTYFENLGNGKFIEKKLPIESQFSSVHHIHTEDFNNDGFLDILLTGNNFEISTQLGRQDASQSVVLINDKKGFFNTEKNSYFDIFGQTRDVDTLLINKEKYYLFARNKDSLIVYKKRSLKED